MLRPARVDFVDVATLGVDEYPFAVAALGADCSIHLMRDLLDEQTSHTVHFNLNRERAYRIVCAGGHVFLLTNRRLHTFVNLAASFLQGRAVERKTLVRSFDIEAVDMTMAFDRSLLVVMPECVYAIEIDFLINDNAPLQDHRAANEKRTPVMGPDSVTTESMGTSGNFPWEQLEHRELAHSLLTTS